MDNNELNVILKKIEEIVGYTLPSKFKKIYLKNKTNIKNINFLSIDEIYREVCDPIDNEVEVELYKSEPKKAILEKSFDPKRVPFISDESGNYIGIDFNPGVNGIIGQIINYGTDEYEMKVLANTFEDFIDGLKRIKIKDNIYVMDYLDENNLNFRKINTISDIKKISNNIEEHIIKEEKKTETIIEKELKFENVKNIITILSEIDNKLMSNVNVRKYKNYWFYLRIINKKDSLSRTMENVESFFEKYSQYNKEEIKGFSFSIVNYIEEIKNNKVNIGEERIFVEINLVNNQTLIRYTETINNNIMFEACNKIIKYINNI